MPNLRQRMKPIGCVSSAIGSVATLAFDLIMFLLAAMWLPTAWVIGGCVTAICKKIGWLKV